MSAATAQLRVTYTSADVDMELFHRLFDEALEGIRAECGRTHSLLIDNQSVRGEGERISDRSPIDTSLILGTFEGATPVQVDRAVKSAKAAQKAWGRRPWNERATILRRAAELIRERKFMLGALMSLEVGKSRME